MSENAIPNRYLLSVSVTHNVVPTLSVALFFVLLCLSGMADITDHYTRMMIYHERIDGNVPEGATLFVGDSITQGMCVAAVCPHGVNYGIGSDTTVGVLQRLPRYVSRERCRAVVLAIGVNDLGRRDNDEIVENYKAILAFATQETPFVCSAVLPLDEGVESVKPGRNERIRALNAALEALCAERVACHFVEVPKALVDDTGNLVASCHVGDGVHPNAEGYRHWIAALKATLAALDGAPGTPCP